MEAGTPRGTWSVATPRWPLPGDSPRGTPTCAAHLPTTGPASCSPTTRPSSAARWRRWGLPGPRPPRSSCRRWSFLASRSMGWSCRATCASRNRPAARRSYCYYQGLTRRKRSFTTSPTTWSPAGWRWPPFDGPGQGMLSFDSKLRPDQEVAVQAIISVLAGRPDVDGYAPGRGRHLLRRHVRRPHRRGGTTGCGRVVRHLQLVHPGRAVRGDGRPDPPGQYQHHGPDPAANMAAMTLAGAAARARVPLLQVYGGQRPRIAAGTRGADRRRVRRAGHHGDLPGRGAHPQQPLGTRRGRCWPTGSRRHSDRRRRAMDYSKAEAKQARTGAGSPACGRPSLSRSAAAAASTRAALRADLDRLTGELGIDGIFSGWRDERVLGAVRSRAAAAHRGRGRAHPGQMPAARPYRAAQRGGDDRADPARRGGRRGLRRRDQPLLPARLRRGPLPVVRPMSARAWTSGCGCSTPATRGWPCPPR